MRTIITWEKVFFENEGMVYLLRMKLICISVKIFVMVSFNPLTDLVSAVKQLLLKSIMIFCHSLIPGQMLCYFCLILLLLLTM